jgi:hypothetical protein
MKQTMEEPVAAIRRLEAVIHNDRAERMGANIRGIIEDIRACRKETTACQEATEAYPEKMEAHPEENKFVAEHETVRKEDAAVETGRALKKRNGDRHLAARLRGQPKERTQGNGGCRKKLAASRRGTTRHAGVTRHKGHGRKGQNRDDVAKRTQKGQTYEKRLWNDQGCKNGIRDRGFKKHLRLGSKTSGGVYR